LTPVRIDRSSFCCNCSFIDFSRSAAGTHLAVPDSAAAAESTAADSVTAAHLAAVVAGLEAGADGEVFVLCVLVHGCFL
jgi:hypothetical protein